ncbi:MAG: tol-pal system protein YbgF, partial [Acidobacteriota bacterium]
MKRAKLALGCLALCLTGLLAACGPGNTLAVGKGSENFRLKAVEANLQKAQDELKAMAGQQQQDDARMAAMQQRIAELVALLEAQGVKVPAAAPKGSALGVGFAHPEATAAPEAAPVAGNTPPSPPSGVSSGASASQTGPAGHVAGPQPGMPGGLPPAPQPHGAARLAQPSPAEQRARRPGGRVGPAEGPTTPEAAIAADRDASGPAPKAASAPA